MDTPVTSGSDLISNPGNANLGYSSGVAYGSNPAVTNPLEGVDNTLARIQQQDANMRMQRHLEQRQDIEGLSQMLAQTNGSLFNMKDAQGNNVSFTPLPGDKKQLEDQADKLRKIVLKKPENYKNDPDFYKAKQELDYMTRHASVRAAFATQENQLAAGEQDQTERSGRLANMNDQINSNLTDYKMPVPYLAGPQVVDEMADPKWQDPKNLEHFGTQIVPNEKEGIDYEVSKMGSPTNALMKPITDVSTKGLTNSRGWQKKWLQNPDSQNPEFINAMNQRITDIAKQRGINPVYASVVNPDRSISQNPNPGEVYAAHNLYSYGSLRTDSKPSDAAMKQKTAAADIQDKKDKLALANKEYELKKTKQAKEDADKAQGDLDASVAAKQVSDVFSTSLHDSRVHNKSVFDKNEDGNWEAVVPQLKDALTSRGFDPTMHTFTKLNHGEQNVKEMIGSNEIPKEAYFIHNIQNKGDDMLVALVPQYQKINVTGEGQKIQELDNWVFVTKKDAIANKIETLSKKAKTVKVANEINQQNQDGNSTTNDSPKTKVIGGVTYQLENGEWFKI